MLGYFSTKRCKGAGKCPIKSNQTERTTDGDYVSEQEIYFHKMDSNAPGSSDRWLPRTTQVPQARTDFYGEVKDGARNYWTDKILQKDGTKLSPQLQVIPSGKVQVRQFSQGSTDGGKTWKVEYDFL
jgi:hypothetical protein